MCTRTRTTCTRTDESTLDRCGPCTGLSLVFIGGLSLLEARGRDFKNEVVQVRCLSVRMRVCLDVGVYASDVGRAGFRL